MINLPVYITLWSRLSWNLDIVKNRDLFYNVFMSKTKQLTVEDILHIAKLANLKLTEEEVEKFRNQLSETISYVENLAELNTDKVTATSHTTQNSNVYFKDGEKNKRQLSQEDALFNAKTHNNKFFVVNRIMND